MKRFLLLATVFISLISSTTYAAPGDKLHHENQWFQNLQDYDIVITPLTGAMVGAVFAGPYGAAAGFVVGGVDEALIHFGYTTEKHLTLGLLAASIGATLKVPYHIASIIGFGMSAAISSGAVELDSSKIAGPLAGVVAGAAYANAKGHNGYVGALIGIAAAWGDGSGFYEGSHLCNTLSSVSTSVVVAPAAIYAISLVPRTVTAIARRLHREEAGAAIAGMGNSLAASLNQPLVAESFGVLSAAYHAYKANTTDDGEIVTPEQLKEELNEVLSRVTGTDVVSTILKQQLLYKLGAAALISQFSIQESLHAELFSTALKAVVPGDLAAQVQLNTVLKNFGLFFIPSIAHSVGDNVVQGFQSSVLARTLAASLRDKTAAGDASLYLMLNEDIKTDVANAPTHLGTLSDKGVAVLWNTCGTYTSAVHSSFVLFNNNAFDIAAFVKSYSGAIEELLAYIQTRTEAHHLEVADLAAKVAQLEKDIRESPKELVIGSKIDFVRKKIENYEVKIRTLNADSYNWALLSALISSAHGIGKAVVSLTLVAGKVTAGQVDKDSKFVTFQASNALISAGNWRLTNLADIQSVKKSKESLTRVLDYLEKAMSRFVNAHDPC